MERLRLAEVLQHKTKVLERHCLDVDRDPAQIKRTVVLDPPRNRRGDKALIREWLTAYSAQGVDEVVIRDSLLRVYENGLPDSLEAFQVETATAFT